MLAALKPLFQLSELYVVVKYSTFDQYFNQFDSYIGA
jgi:hypothetical protein